MQKFPQRTPNHGRLNAAVSSRYHLRVLGTDRHLRRRLLKWYDRDRRDLPWRVKPGQSGLPDPYHVLVSETMLQQTQVATVIPYYRRFLEEFSTIEDLAEASEQRVLRLWQGLGYYSRARNLHAAAKTMVSQHGAQIPSQVEDLIRLPGIGRYTAGAIASIAFNRPAPILDGNVTRVLCRLDGIQTDSRTSGTSRELWTRATELVPAGRPGDFNSALMELGATVCTHRSPRCPLCPVQNQCIAANLGIQDDIPPSRKSPPVPVFRRYTYCIRHKNHWLLEQRPSRGRWASMWQFITCDKPNPRAFGMKMRDIQPLTTLRHTLTHRRYEFQVFQSSVANRNGHTSESRRWLTLADLEEYPLPGPHLKIRQMLLAASPASARSKK
jgi:A/G-specific adenine glycosylase